ncbi:MAG: hypothetical protein A2Y34_07235 [Spirochaetes bacterium GWC1_27_15]|nr:MAG: hypothetical protein A2Y34_07235 [Spirochaetes bacterium GWC1_27_15]
MKKTSNYFVFLFFILIIGCYDYITDLDTQFPRNNPNDQKSSNYKTTTTTTSSTSSTSTTLTTSSTSTTSTTTTSSTSTTSTTLTTSTTNSTSTTSTTLTTSTTNSTSTTSTTLTTSSTSTTSTTSTSTTSTTTTTSTSTTTTTIPLWLKSYNNTTYNEQISEIKNTNDNGYISVGTTSTDIYLSDAKCLIIKFDGFGNISWKKTINIQNYYQISGKSIYQTSNGDYLVSCGANDGNNNYFLLLIRIDSSGNVLWKKNYTFTDTSYKFSQSLDYGKMVQTSDNNYLLYGNTSSANAFIFKIDGNGSLLMQKIYKPVSGYNYIDNITITKDGGFITAGYKVQSVYLGGGIPPTTYYQYWIMKLSNSCTIEWEKEYSTNSIKINSVKIEQTNNLNYIFVGNIYSTFNDIIVFKLNNTGDFIWKKVIGNSMYNIPYNAYITDTEECIIVGENHYESGSNNKNGLVVSVNSNGSINYQRCYFYEWYDMFNNIIKRSDGSYLIGGQHGADYGEITDQWLTHVDSNCNILNASFIYTSDLTSSDYTITAATSSTSITDVNLNIDTSITLVLNNNFDITTVNVY